jgi:hypothetical protein
VSSVALSRDSWPLNAIKFPTPGRIDPTHKVMTLAEAGLSTAEGWDDEILFNTQAQCPYANSFTPQLINQPEIFAMG